MIRSWSKRFIFAIVLYTLCGCVPENVQYVYPEPKNAIYLFEPDYRCHIAYPPSTAYFSYNGIFLSLSFSQDNLGIGVHVPEGKEVELEGGHVSIFDPSGSKRPSEDMLISPDNGYIPRFVASHELNNMDVLELKSKSGLLTGDKRVNAGEFGHLELPIYPGYWFVSPLRGHELPANGVVMLPPMKINGVHFDGAVVPFRHRHSFMLIPICM